MKKNRTQLIDWLIDNCLIYVYEKNVCPGKFITLQNLPLGATRDRCLPLNSAPQTSRTKKMQTTAARNVPGHCHNFPKRVIASPSRAPSYSPEPWPYWCRRHVSREWHRFCFRRRQLIEKITQTHLNFYRGDVKTTGRARHYTSGFVRYKTA